MLKQVAVLFLFIFMTSCTATYYINVRQDGSAVVNVDRNYPSVLDKYFQSSVICKIDTTNEGDRVEFEISNIDSLGNYLPLHPPDFFHFNLNNKILTITNGDKHPFVNEHWSCCSINMLIKFSSSIEYIKTKNRRIHKEDNNTVFVGVTRKQLKNEKNKLNVTIKIK